MAEKRYDTLIAGGGIAGLTAAAYLARAGRKVLLMEKNRECGGLVNTFVRDGFHFDAGVRALEDAGIILPMLAELGIPLDRVESPVSVGVEDKILHVTGRESLEEYRNLLTSLYPGSKSEIDKVITSIRKIMKSMDVLYGIENPLFKDLKKDKTYLFRTLLPWLPGFLFTVRKINRLNMPVETYLAGMITNPSLRDIISQHFFRNTPAFFAMSYFSLYLDYFYPRGGVGTLAKALEKKIGEWGGEIRTETRVTGVQAAQRSITDQDHTPWYYDHLIWAADLKTFYRITSVQNLPENQRRAFGEVKEKMLERRGGDSVFTLYVEADIPPERFKEIAHGHFFYTPSREGLGETHRSELDTMIADRAWHDKEKVLAWLERFTRLNTYEISIPVLKDPSLAPAGKTGLIISFLAEYDLFAGIREAGWYDDFVREMEQQIIRVISATVFPFLAENILAQFSFTPVSIANRVGSSEGAITGWSFQEPVPVVHKMQLSDRSVLTPLPDVFQAGQWAYSPAGVPMSILTGKLAATRILKK